jgi:hypothetical protein
MKGLVSCCFLFSEGGGMRVGNDYQAKVPEYKPGILDLI